MSRTGLFGRAACLALTLAAAPGCGDPEASRLAAGSRAVVVARGREQDSVHTVDSSYFLEIGTHVSVVDDAARSPADAPYREVRVHIEDGDYRGRTDSVLRWDLRPE